MQVPLEKERLHRFVRRPLERKFYPTERDEAVLMELFDGLRHTAQLQPGFPRWIGVLPAPCTYFRCGISFLQ